jgi:O-antigen/teichoic acid export membrane protein
MDDTGLRGHEEPGGAEDAKRRPSLARSASWTFGTQAAVAVISLVNVLIVSRWLGPGGRGEVVFLTTVAWLTSQIASLSIAQSAANIPGRRPHLRRALAGNAVVLSLLLGGAAICALVVLLTVFPEAGPNASPGLEALALALIPPLILSDYLGRMAFADFGIGVVNAALLISPVGNAVVNFILALTGHLTVASAFTVWAAGQLAGLFLIAWYIQTRLAGFGRPERRLAREMVTFGLKSHGGRVLQLGNYRLDQWLVGAIAGNRELGLYSVAVAWSEGLFILPRALMDAQRPYLVRLDRRSAGTQAASVLRLTTLITAPIAVLVVLLAPFLCVTVFGSSFHGSIADLRILALGAFGISATKILGSALIAQERPLLEGLATAAAFATTVALDFLLIPRHGGLGAAFASTIAYSAGGVAVAVIASRTLGFHLSELKPRLADIGDAKRMTQTMLRRVARRPASVTELGSG